MARGFAIALALLLAGPALASARPCTADIHASDVRTQPGPPLRFGIGPLVQAGQAGGGPAVAVAEQPARTHAALARLKAPGRPFVLRLNRFFWSDGEPGFRRYLGLARRFARRGYLIELQVRYHPDGAQEGDLSAWRAHVREVVRRFGRIRAVIALQIANEVSITFSPDSSDGAYRRAPEALVDGVIAAKREVRRLGLPRLKIGFNWFWRLDAATERRFWQALRDHGGRRFGRAVDWIGLDAYPGTVFPPNVPPGGERDAIVSALRSVRCFARVPGIPRSTPIKVEENGWPTLLPARGYAEQAQRLRRMARAVHDYRGTFGVSDYRWFNLRDADSSSQALFQHFGLLESDYDAKPAFAVYGELVRRLGGAARVRP
ncbi:MAG: hypothetical protein H0T69_15765 [Thermoleophilaceae bacterium]|nr:hypothetical protein [Thermoleophilaceae bacterium]